MATFDKVENINISNNPSIDSNIIDPVSPKLDNKDYLGNMVKHWGTQDLSVVNADTDSGLEQELTAHTFVGNEGENMKDANYTGDDAIRNDLTLEPKKDSDTLCPPGEPCGIPGNKGPYGKKKRAEYFQKPVHNLLKIVRKLRDFSYLSEAYREKHLEVEDLTLTIRKLYYILIFIKDQIKHVLGAEDDIHRLIDMIVTNTDQWKRLIGPDELNKLKLRQKALKHDRNRLEKVFEIASKAVLRKLSKMGASVTNIVDINNAGPEYGQWKNMFTDINVPASDTDIAELEKLFEDYNSGIKRINEGTKFLIESDQTLDENTKLLIEKQLENILTERLGEEHTSKVTVLGKTETDDMAQPTQLGGANNGEPETDVEDNEAPIVDVDRNGPGTPASEVITEDPTTITVAADSPIQPTLTTTGEIQRTEEEALKEALTKLPNDMNLGKFKVYGPNGYILNTSMDSLMQGQEQLRQQEAERLAKEEAERLAKEEAERLAKEEAERLAKEEAERKAREEAERKAKEEAERKAKEEAERKAREEAERKAKEEAERKAKEEESRLKAEEQARLNALAIAAANKKPLKDILKSKITEQKANLLTGGENSLNDLIINNFSDFIDEKGTPGIDEEYYTQVKIKMLEQLNISGISNKDELYSRLDEPMLPSEINITDKMFNDTLTQFPTEIYKSLRDTLMGLPGVIAKITDHYTVMNNITKDKNNQNLQNHIGAGGAVGLGDKCIKLGENCLCKDIITDVCEKRQCWSDNCIYGKFKFISSPGSNVDGETTVEPTMDGDKVRQPKNEDFYKFIKEKYGLKDYLVNGKIINLFAYGFSGSGKTYTLIEGNDATDKSIMKQFVIDLVTGQIENLKFKDIKIDIYYPVKNNEGESESLLSGKFNEYAGLKTQVQDIQTEISKAVELIKEDSEQGIKDFSAQIKALETLMVKYLLIVPTTNNPNSSRAFTIFEIECENAGTFRFIDLPGLEKTVDIKRELLLTPELVENLEAAAVETLAQSRFTDKKINTINYCFREEFGSKRQCVEQRDYFNQGLTTYENQSITDKKPENYFTGENQINLKNIGLTKGQADWMVKLVDGPPGSDTSNKNFNLYNESQNKDLLEIFKLLWSSPKKGEKKNRIDNIEFFLYLDNTHLKDRVKENPVKYVFNTFLKQITTVIPDCIIMDEENLKGKKYYKIGTNNLTHESSLFSGDDINYFSNIINKDFGIDNYKLSTRPEGNNIFEKLNTLTLSDNANSLAKDYSFTVKVKNQDVKYTLKQLLSAYYKSPLTYCFFLIMQQVVENSSKIATPKLKKNAIYKFGLLMAIRYVNYIVEQGKAIVTSLEHLKFVFLKRSQGAEQLRLYNEKKATEVSLDIDFGKTSGKSKKYTGFSMGENNEYREDEVGNILTFADSTYQLDAGGGFKELVSLKYLNNMSKIMKENQARDTTKYLLLMAMIRQAEDIEGKQSSRCQGAYETLQFGQSVSAAEVKGCQGVALPTQTAGRRLNKSQKRRQRKNNKVTKKRNKKNLKKNKTRKH